MHPVVIAKEHVKRSRPRKETPLSDEQRIGFPLADTLEDIKEQVSHLHKSLKEERQERLKLTEQEKIMTRAELEKRWAEERFEQRYGPRPQLPLTPEEQSLTRPQLQSRWAASRRA